MFSPCLSDLDPSIMMKGVLSLLVLVFISGCTDDKALSGELRVCLPQSDLPRADRQTLSGFDMDVARLVARELSTDFVPVWLSRPGRTEIEVSDINYALLISGDCDLLLSVPGDDAVSDQPMITLTAPYYGTAFELIPDSGLHDLRNWQGTKIAVRSNTVAHIVVDRYGLPWTMKRDTRELLAAVQSGKAGAALVWGPDLGSTKYNTSFDAPSVLKWNQHMATRTSDKALREKINSVIGRKNTNRDIMGLLARHHVPVHAPFSKTFQISDLEDLH